LAVPTGAKGLDEMLGGGLPESSPVQVFGLKAVGKSILSMQVAARAAAEGGSSVIVDTEMGYLNNIIPHWLAPLNGRFGANCGAVRTSIVRSFDDLRRKRSAEAFLKEAIVSALKQVQLVPSDQQLTEALNIFMPNVKIEAPPSDGPAIYVVEAPGLVELLALHGVKVDLVVSEGGRVEVRLQPHGLVDPTGSPLGRFAAERRASLMVYDSISAPMKATFAGTQDLPARSSSLALLLGQVQRMCASKKMVVVAINHISVRPHNPAWTHPYGGLIVGYDFKYVFHLEKAPSESKLKELPLTNPELVGKGNRLVWAYRHPRIDDYGAAALLKLDDAGFH
jgi:hypothetical protein